MIWTPRLGRKEAASFGTTLDIVIVRFVIRLPGKSSRRRKNKERKARFINHHIWIVTFHKVICCIMVSR
jgi:hypothetical protein